MKHSYQFLIQVVTLWVTLLVIFALPQFAQAQQADGPHLAFKKSNASPGANNVPETGQTI